ncbi:DUF6443 domain-containing protein [Myroides profundi]|uniref:RHS repeat-associated core domain-containing protein n=1 Tax=Myroides profundi TaxID=480520 RepID=A0AAJ5BE39_MYRPR|nr:DUF6443 domain-containing protein [Myroides profundi]AJH14556.1 RHS repeat-associated core domain-containing protein [Myroides profundi]SEQ92748.1 RHS repeat-associated core domain-containing protein [Myroides profundi]
MKTYKYIVLFSICCLNTIVAQTKSQNYIKTTQYTQPVKQASTTVAQKTQVVYYDGLGRPIQEVAVGASPTKNSVVKHTEYDLNIGQTKDFLSYSVASGSSEYVANAKTGTLNYYNTDKYQKTTNPYSETLYEKSPLKRVLKTGSPGEDWKISGNNTIDFSYRFNTANEVKYRQAKATLASATGIYNVTIVEKGTYPVNSLYVTSVSDENGNVAQEFKDQEGKVVLKRVYNNPQGVPTLFSTASNAPMSSPMPSVSNIIGDELKGKSVQDVIDNFDKIVENLEKNVDNQIDNTTKEVEQLPNNPLRGSGVITGTGETLDTYYIYDQYGNLSIVTSPLLNGDVTLANVDKLGYQYKYDTKNRLVAKKLPGKTWEYMVYDKSDRLVAIGPVYNPFGTEAKGWMVTKYDAHSRVIYSGFYNGLAVSETTRKTFQDNVNANAISFEKRASSTNIGGAPVTYTNTVFPKDNLTVLSVNYYDDYTYPGAATNFTAIEGQTVIQNAKGLLTGNWTRVLTTSSENKANITFMLYDYNSRVLRSYTKNYLQGYTQVDTKYTFTGLPLKVTTKHKKDNVAVQSIVEENFVYDHAERLLQQTHKVNTLAEVVLFKNVYDELGALEKKDVGGNLAKNIFFNTNLYLYNVRGWLTDINSIANYYHPNLRRPLFLLKLNYNKPEQSITGVNALYNGNISEQIWTSGIDNKKRSYGYVYDGANRLVLGSFKSPDLGSASTANLYDEKLAYDKNGNILKLDRNGASVGGVTTVIDKLTYGYESGSNRLSTVRDASGNQEGFKQVNTVGSDYTYDEFGNLTSDKHKKITKIKHNHLNLPVEINFGTDKIEYLYTASGEKLQKKVTEKGVVTLTDYLGGFQYVKGKLSFLPTAEGFFNAETNSYVYQFKDHLGNVRVSYSDINNENLILPHKIIEEINYYPFGLAHKGYNQKNDALMKDYKYQYNGKEKQEELGLNYYDYGARNYDAAIGRWMNVDPLAEKFVGWNPYHYVHNNPINLVDPTGMEAEGRENDYLFDNKNNLIAVTYTDSKDRYFTESAYSATSMKFQNSKGDIKHGEEFSPDFAIVEIMAEVEGSIGHSAIGFDGNTFNYYPTKDDGTTRDFGAGNLFGTDLQQVVSSQSDFKERYPLANSYFAKVSPEQKTSLSTSLSFKGETLGNSGEKYNLIYNNCTTNVSNHLIGAGILESDSYRRRPGTFNSMLKSSGNISGSISRESSIGRTVRNNVRESLNNMTVNGKRVK